MVMTVPGQREKGIEPQDSDALTGPLLEYLLKQAVWRYLAKLLNHSTINHSTRCKYIPGNGWGSFKTFRGVKSLFRDFPLGSVVKTLCSPCRGLWVQSLVGE